LVTERIVVVADVRSDTDDKQEMWTWGEGGGTFSGFEDYGVVQ
jgi:hypothetical protein